MNSDANKRISKKIKKAEKSIIAEEQVRQKVLSQFKNYKLQIPLVNPETLFSLGAWEQAFDFIHQYLKEACKNDSEIETNKNLIINISDLYFMKSYNEDFDFRKAEKLVSVVGETKYHLTERNDRNDEPSLEIGDNFRLYDYRGAICFSASDAVNSDVLDIKEGHFPREPVRLSITLEGFLKFVDIIEKVLTGQGSSEMCRAFMEVESSNFGIGIKCLYESPVDLIAMRCFSESGDFGFMNRQLKSIAPEFTVKMKS